MKRSEAELLGHRLLNFVDKIDAAITDLQALLTRWPDSTTSSRIEGLTDLRRLLFDFSERARTDLSAFIDAEDGNERRKIGQA